ncbi:MAG TPA: LLM class F420-dependent oxidoreductase [Streptosporangiaceae bacterium]|nr:LLM class F420-dependent oxidoreductase [Streptosporangiaceae bacterium]
MDRLGMTVPVAGETMAELPAVLDELAAAGYSDIWTSEVNATDAFAPLLMAAQRVPRLRLGTSIAGVFSRSPALMAMSALAVAELSDQPVYVGVGSSSQNMVEQWHGTAFVQPYQRVRDTVRFLRAAFAGGRVTFHGDTFEVDGFRLGRVPPHPPRILVAALREGMLRMAGRESDGVVLNWLSPDDTARVVPLVLDGNPAADVVARLFVVTAPDRETARGMARRMVTAYLNTGVYAEYQRWLGRGPALEAMWTAWQAGDRRGALAAVPDSVIDELFVIGTPAEIRSGVAGYVRAGITIPVLAVLAPDRDSIRKLAVELGQAPST